MSDKGYAKFQHISKPLKYNMVSFLFVCIFARLEDILDGQ